MRFVLVITLTFALTTAAFANGGTPLILGSIFYLLVGNAFIAALETAVIRRLHPRLKTVQWQLVEPDDAFSRFRDSRGLKLAMAPPILAANYFSAFAGAYLLGVSDPFRNWLLGERPIENLWLAVVAFYVCAFLFTLAAELPFYSLVTGLKTFSRENVRTVLAAHLVSYSVLTLWFLFLSNNSILRDVRTVAPAHFAASPGWVYYYRADSGDLRRVRTDGSKDELVLPVAVPVSTVHWNAALSAEPSTPNLERACLRLVYPWQDQEPTLLLEDIGLANRVAELERKPDGTPMYAPFGFGSDRAFGGRKQAPYFFGTRFWAAEGLFVRTPESHYWIALETPLIAWSFRAATALPSRHGVVEFGPQIVLIDPQTKRMAFLAKGRSPAVVLDQ
jgi:hypothetical protein